MRLRTVVGAVLLAAAVGLVGCSRPNPLVVGLYDIPVTLDPHHHNDAATWALLTNFYDALVVFNEEMKLQPALAQSWQQVDDTHVRFDLRRDAAFADGAVLRAADVVASFRRARDNRRSAIRYFLLGIRDVTAADDHTVMVETEGPSPTLLNRLVFLFVVPETEAAREEITSLNGTGAYRMVAYTPGVSLTAEAKPGPKPPEVRRVQFLFFRGSRALSRGFMAGGIDVANVLNENDVVEQRPFGAGRAQSQPRLHVMMLAVNPSAASGPAARALADRDVREAMLLAMDRARFPGGRGSEAVATQYVHPVVFGYDPAIPRAPFEPERARALMKKAGFAEGFDVDLGLAPAQDEMGGLIRDDLARLGIRVHLTDVSWPELMERGREGRNALTIFGWSCTTGDASDWLNACLHSSSPELGLGHENVAGCSDPEIDRIIEAADREIDPGRRLQLLKRAQGSALAALRYLPLSLRFGYLGLSPRVDVPPRVDLWARVASYRWRAHE